MNKNIVTNTALTLLLAIGFQAHAMDSAVAEGFDGQDGEQSQKQLEQKKLDAKLLNAAKTERYGVEGVSKYLDAGANIETTDQEGKTPLMLACYSRAVEAVGFLLTKGANVEAQDKEGNTALIWTIKNRDKSTDITELLLKNGAKTESKDLNGDTALIWAISLGRLKIIEVLLNYGAKTTVKNKNGATILMIASTGMHSEGTDILYFFINRGEDPLAIDNSNETVYNHVISTRITDRIHYFHNVENAFITFKNNPLAIMNNTFTNVKIEPKSTYVKMLYNNDCYYVDLIKSYNTYGHKNNFKEILKEVLFSLTQKEREVLRKTKKTPLLPMESDTDSNFIKIVHQKSFTDLIFEFE